MHGGTVAPGEGTAEPLVGGGMLLTFTGRERYEYLPASPSGLCRRGEHAVGVAQAGTPTRPSSRSEAVWPAEPQKPKLLDRLREALRSRHYSRRTEQTYLPLGEAIHLLPPCPASRRDGRAGDQRLPDTPRRQGEGQRLDPEPGARRPCCSSIDT